MEALSALTIGNNVLRARVRVRGAQERLVAVIATRRLVVRPALGDGASALSFCYCALAE
jgi:hypothetical protein